MTHLALSAAAEGDIAIAILIGFLAFFWLASFTR